ADRVWASPYGLRSRTLRTVAATAPDRPIGRPRATSTRCGGGVSRGTSVPPTTSAAGRGGPYGESPTEKWKPSTVVLPQRSGRTSFVVRRVHAPVRAARLDRHTLNLRPGASRPRKSRPPPVRDRSRP